MKYLLISIIFLFFLLNPADAQAATYYVDNTLSSDCLSGNYSITNRDCSGSDGNAYNTIQDAINIVSAGDTIYMRGGTYNEHIAIPNNKQGNNNAWIILTSYPGEWAKIDPGHDVGSGYGAWVIRYKGGGYGIAPSYWKFSRFEVTGGGINSSSSHGGGILLDTAHHIIFEYLYIHDNYANKNNNPAGIAVFTENEAPQYITIQYNWLADNGSYGDNAANVLLMSDYVDTPSSVNINRARHHNEIKYNLMEGSNAGFYHKSEQYLSLDHTGTHIAYNDYGDKIHHNIIRDFHDDGISARGDFIQIYNNILESSNSMKGISIGSSHSNTEREPFYALAYNNTLINVDGRIKHQTGSYEVYSPPLHPHVYWYNNIFESVGAEHGDFNDLNIFLSWTVLTEADIEMDKVHVENNLFYPRTASEEIINLADENNDYSANQYKTAGYATILYTTTVSGLHVPGSDYKTNPAYTLEGITTIANGGIGGVHPYLSGVTIPSYVNGSAIKTAVLYFLLNNFKAGEKVYLDNTALTMDVR